MKSISLSQGKIAWVSNCDYDHLIQWKWTAQRIKNKWYAVRSEGPAKKRKHILMHREIMNAPPEMDVDHWDDDGLNNTRLNLRVSTRSQNKANQAVQSNNSSGFKGVTQKRNDTKWTAQISFQGERIYIGRFDDPISAAFAYDRKARELFGKFAKTNF